MEATSERARLSSTPTRSRRAASSSRPCRIPRASWSRSAALADRLPLRVRPRRLDGAHRRLPVGHLDRLRRGDRHRARLRRLRAGDPRLRPEQGQIPPAGPPRDPDVGPRLHDGGLLDLPRRRPAVARSDASRCGSTTGTSTPSSSKSPSASWPTWSCCGSRSSPAFLEKFRTASRRALQTLLREDPPDPQEIDPLDHRAGPAPSDDAPVLAR